MVSAAVKGPSRAPSARRAPPRTATHPVRDSWVSRRTPASQMAAKELPEDIVAEILARLPVKTLIRFRSVSKTWRALIRSSSFVNHHLNQSLREMSSSSSSTFLALVNTRIDDYEPYLLLVSVDKVHCRLTSVKEFYLPEADQKHDILRWRLPVLRGCGCGNCGVYCMTDLLADRTVIWNPATRETKRVPSIGDNQSTYQILVAFNCTMDKNSKFRDFKIMQLVCGLDGPPVVHVYTMSTNSWIAIAHDQCGVEGLLYDSANKWFKIQNTRDICVDSVVNLHHKAHWLVKLDTESNAVMFFDFEKVYFGVIPVPEVLKYRRLQKSRLVLTLFDSKCLCVIFKKRSQKFNAWVLREQCWVQLSIGNNMLKSHSGLRP